MRKVPVIANFDGVKFAARYGLSAMRGEFFIDADGMLNFPDSVIANPILETVDPPKPAVATRLDGAKTLPDLIAVLKDVLK